MGNHRQQLKDNLATDLRTKIEETQLLLAKFKLEQEDVERTCVEAKAQIQTATDLLAQKLTERQSSLIKEVDLRGQADVTNLQTNIQNSYLMLGSLQTTLYNLDSFDNSQLLNLQIPISNQPYTATKSRRLVIDTNCEELLEKIQHWGHVDSPSSPGNIAYLDDEDMNEFVQVSSEIFYPQLPGFPKPSTPSALPTNEFAKDGGIVGTLQKSDIQHWLESKLETESDCFEGVSDFEMLAMEQEQLMNMRRGSDDSIVPDISTPQERGGAHDDSSSLVVVVDSEIADEKLDMVETLGDELSMWLKPRTTRTGNTPQKDLSQSVLATPPPPVPAEMMTQTPKTTSTVSSKSHFFDYPGLRLDPRCWLPKKPKAQFKLSTELALNMSEKEIIPPAYAALPYPFWLKKC